MQSFGNVYSSFNEMAAATGALQNPSGMAVFNSPGKYQSFQTVAASQASGDVSGMSVFNAFRALVENTEVQYALIKQLRDEVEFQPDNVLKTIAMYLPRCRDWLTTPNVVPGGVPDMQKFIAELEAVQQEVYDRRDGKYDKPQRIPIDLTEIQLRSGTPSVEKSGDSDTTPEVR